MPSSPEPTAESILAWATRDLLRAESAEDVAEVLAEVVDRLGGQVVPARTAPPHALPLDVGVGLSEPMLPTADPGSPALAALHEHLPTLVADARRVRDRILRTAHLSATVGRDPTTGLQTRAAFVRALGQLRPDDRVLVVRVEVPEPTDEVDDGLDDAVLAFAAHLQGRLGVDDQAARIEEDEFGVLLRRPAPAGDDAGAWLQDTWAPPAPGVRLHVGAAAFRDSGVATLRAAYEALDRDLAGGRSEANGTGAP